jgi:hypothetical protein
VAKYIAELWRGVLIRGSYFASVAAVAHQAGALERREVLGDHGLRDTGALRQSVDGVVAVAGEPLEERPSGGVGESFEDAIGSVRHDQTITMRLLIAKRKFCAVTTCICVPEIFSVFSPQ